MHVYLQFGIFLLFTNCMPQKTFQNSNEVRHFNIYQFTSKVKILVPNYGNHFKAYTDIIAEETTYKCFKTTTRREPEEQLQNSILKGSKIYPLFGCLMFHLKHIRIFIQKFSRKVGNIKNRNAFQLNVINSSTIFLKFIWLKNL